MVFAKELEETSEYPPLENILLLQDGCCCEGFGGAVLKVAAG